MGYDKYASLVICLSILVLIAGVFAVEEIDETLYRFLASHYVPPPACPENEAWNECLRDCSDCTWRGACRVEGCARKGCDCRQNFVRLTTGGSCVPVHECPKPECGENESFRECGPVCETCGGMRCTLLQCEHRCYCDQGHLREGGGGKCVPEEQCPTKFHCHRNEEQKKSGRKDEYCLRDKDEEPSNATETKDRCYCKEGFSRNTMGLCVADKYCTMTHCFLGEVYQSCPRKCNATCRAYDDASCEEDGQCFPGCFCPEGTHMDDMQRCVTLEQCPPGSNPFAPTAGPTPTPAMTPSTANNAPGLNPTTNRVSNSTVENYGDTPGLSTEDAERSTTASTSTVTSQTTAQVGTETSTTSEEKNEPKDPAAEGPKGQEAGIDLSAENPKDQDADSVKDQTDDGPKDQEAGTDLSADSTNDGAKDQADDGPKGQNAGKDLSADSTNGQDADGAKDQSDDGPKDQEARKDLSANSTKDQHAESTKDQSEATSKAPAQFQKDDQDEDVDESGKEVQVTTTAKPKSSKKPDKDEKEYTKAKKATTPVDMDEENE